ncbi:hypothetical protein [Metallosphaera hakonensis]|nr:hypothetical protein [Metallosphaera hakonensis]AWR99357.2 hypothetical protein DFR87_06145 [Metallosphaera hakonensis JCM 8857 = DSM 7519]
MSLSAYQNEVYVIKESSNGVLKLIYEYKTDGKVQLRLIRARASGWKKSVVLWFLSEIGVEKDKPIYDFNNGGRISAFMSILPYIYTVNGAKRTGEVLKDMGIEEVAFWRWKLNQLKLDAVMAFKRMYKVK